MNYNELKSKAQKLELTIRYYRCLIEKEIHQREIYRLTPKSINNNDGALSIFFKKADNWLKKSTLEEHIKNKNYMEESMNSIVNESKKI